MLLRSLTHRQKIFESCDGEEDSDGDSDVDEDDEVLNMIDDEDKEDMTLASDDG